ncbi:MAG: YchJ family metal-binding protein [Mariprofundus sp.]|nr:YchJ family metal-binding protein [Mariprofundus sp.]
MRESNCPCGSGNTFSHCCKNIIEGAIAPNAEAVMQSRYSAYVLGYWDYLRQSYHSKTRPSKISPTTTNWLGLIIKSSTEDSVEFIAIFREGNKIMCLHETSRFAQQQGHWRYLDGNCTITEAARNAPCPCGSQLKTKRCCGKKT